MIKKILFLQTQQNHIWTSMEEILPHIQKVWERLADELDSEIHVINVDIESVANHMKEILECDLVVACAFNLKIVGFLRFIREKIGVNAPLYFYLHNQATIGLWPLAHFQLWSDLRKSDVFLGTCEGDVHCMDLLKLKTHQTLFSSEESKEALDEVRKQDIHDIIYVGRISRQKNLEQLILAFKELKKEKASLKLHLYGKEDHLGHPNMGIKDSHYQSELEELAQGDDIYFHGFVQREEIKKIWRNRPFIFCSPSLHSDENFGMAALMALELGGRAVLSSWGGHKNFEHYFPERVIGVPVLLDSETGISLGSEELRDALKESLRGEPLEQVDSPFHLKAIVNGLMKKVEDKKPVRSQKIELPIITEKLLKQRERFDPKGQKVFESHLDPLAQHFFKAYGAK